MIYLVAGALCCSFLGHLAGLWWGFSLMHQFQLQACWGGVAFVLLAVCLRHWRAAFLSALLLLSGFVAIFPAAHTGNSAKQGDLKAVSYNVLTNNSDQRELVDWVRGEKPDMIVLVEANQSWTDTAALLAGTLPYQKLVSGPGNYGLIFMSRFPVRDAHVVPAGTYQLPLLVADLETPQGMLRVFSIHTMAPVGPENTLANESEILQMKDLVLDSPYPALVMGDFNAAPWMPVMQKLIRGAGLSGVTLIPSWPSAIVWLGLPLDQILGTRGVSISNVGNGPGHHSDHRARIATFFINTENALSESGAAE